MCPCFTKNKYCKVLLLMAIFFKKFTKYCRIAEQKVLKTFEFFNTELDTEWTLLTGILNSNFEHIDFVSLAEKGNDN